MLDYIKLQVEYFPELDKKQQNLAFFVSVQKQSFLKQKLLLRRVKKQSALEKGIDSETALAYWLYHKEMQRSTTHMISKKKG